jgi:hypothetical protein
LGIIAYILTKDSNTYIKISVVQDIRSMNIIRLIKIIKKDIEFIFTGSSEIITKDFEENKFK